MPKYAFIGAYTSESLSGMIERPDDREAALGKAVDAAGGRLDNMYWMFGADDFMCIADCPDDTAASAVSLAVASSGAARSLRTVRLITAQEMQRSLEKAKTVAGAFIPPGARQPARVG